MKKIPTVFVRDPDTNLRHVKNEVHPDCQWVIDGEGVATRKWDGTCVMIGKDGSPWARREVKPGKEPPALFWEVERDETTGKSVGWQPMGESSFSAFFEECYDEHPPGTYELCGPKVNGNPEKLESHMLIPHGKDIVDPPRDFDGLHEWLHSHEYEGIVWHHPDGRMAKLKKKDFPKK